MVPSPLLLLVLAGPAPAGYAARADDLPPASRWIPREAPVVFEVSRPEALLDLALDERLAAVVEASPAFQQAASQPGFQGFLGVLRFLELKLETDWRTGLCDLLGGGLTLAVDAQGGTLLIVDAKDEQLLEDLHGLVVEFATLNALGKDSAAPPASREVQGVPVWSFGGDEVHAVLGRRLLLANREESLEAALSLRDDSGARSITSLPAWQAAREAAGEDATARLFVNLDILKQVPDFHKGLEEGENPAASLLVPGAIEVLRRSSWAALVAEVEGDTVSLRAVTDGQLGEPSIATAFAWPPGPHDGALPNLDVPRQIAGLTFFRDLETFYASKDELFPQRTSGLIFFENMMGIFFSGRDLVGEVLAETGPEIRFVVAEQDYDPAIGTPRVRMPSFAAILRLRDPERFTEVVEEAWQKALGLINFTRGQQALPGLIIDRMTHGETRYSVAYYSSSALEERTDLDSRYNWRPALARVGDFLILSSTDGLTRDLIDALERECAGQAPALAGTHSFAELDGNQLASILTVNRENLVLQNMVEKGNTREQAEAGIDLLTTVVQQLGWARLRFGWQDGRALAELQLALDLPATGRESF